MATYTQILYHIVFATKNRRSVLDVRNREQLLKYMWGIFKQKNCHLYRINCVDDHVHILVAVHPSISLSNLIRDLKVSTSKWIKENEIFPGFDHWQDGYGAFTLSNKEKNRIAEYIKEQGNHHKRFSFLEEYRKFLKDEGIAFDERYIT